MFSILEGLESRRLLASNLVADYGGIYPTGYVTVEGVSYFTADDGVHGRELWKSDGTAAGTQLVKDITPGAAASQIQNLSAVGDQVLFIVKDNQGGATVWRSDGTLDGTFAVKAIDLDGSDGWYVSGVANDHLIFTVQRHHGPITGDELWDWQLWSSDGTANGTGPIKTVLGASGAYYNYVEQIYGLGEHAVFMGVDGKTWSTDGTAGGTLVLRNGGLTQSDTAILNGKLVFSASSALWATDGTLAGTTQFSNMSGGQFVQFNGKLLFEHLEYTDSDMERWLAVTDGTAAGTKLLAQSPGGPWNTSWGAALGDEFIVPIPWSIPGAGLPADNFNELWKTDGTPEGTSRIEVVPMGDPAWFANPFASAGGLVFFVANNPDNEHFLWQTDGTAAGTKLVQQVSESGYLREIDGKLAIQSGYQEDSPIIQLFDPGTLTAPIGPTQGAISLKDGVMRIHGTQGDDSIRIYHHTSDPNRFVVNLNGVKKSFLISAVTRIYIYGYSGNDNISFYDGYGRVATRSRIWGGSGNDVVYTGSNRDTIFGDAGNDSLNSGHNDDIVMGGDGDDSVNASFGNDTASGENGSDHVEGGMGQDVVSGGDDGSQDWVDGGAGADVVFGSAVLDIFFGGQQAGDPLDEILMG